MRSGGCGSWTVWRATARAPSVDLHDPAGGSAEGSAGPCGAGGGAERRGWASREPAHGVSGAAGVPRQEIVAAAAARVELEVEAVSEAELAGALSAAAGGGLIFRASCRCGRSFMRCRRTSMCCCWCCTTLPATAGRWARCGGTCGVLPGAAAAGMRRRFLRCRCNMPTTRCGSARFWARRATAAARLSRQLSYWRRRLRSCRSRSSCRLTGRGLRCRAIAAAACRLRLDAALHGGLLAAFARAGGASLFMVLQAGLAALLTRLGSGR